MKNLIFLTALVMALPLDLQAQDDLYFTPKKKDKTVKTIVTEQDTPVYHSGSRRDVDEYNRRGLYSYYQPLDTDTVVSDTIDIFNSRNMADVTYGGNASEYDEDYTYSRRMSRFDDFYWYNSPWDYPFYYGSPYWHARWGWYDPWYAGWYDPWYYPWYNGWYYPVHVGWHHHWYRPVWAGGAYRPYHGLTGTGHVGSFSRGTGVSKGRFGGSRGNNNVNRKFGSNRNNNFNNNRNNNFNNNRQYDNSNYRSPSQSSGSFGGSRGGSFGGSRGGSFGGGSRGGSFGGRR